MSNNLQQPVIPESEFLFYLNFWDLDDDFRGLKKKTESWMYLEDTFAFYEDYLVIIIFVQSLLIVEHYYFCENGSLS